MQEGESLSGGIVTLLTDHWEFVLLPEPLRCEEVEQVEKLLQVVLQRSSSQQQFVLQRVVVQHPEKLRTGQTKRNTSTTETRNFHFSRFMNLFVPAVQ